MPLFLAGKTANPYLRRKNDLPNGKIQDYTIGRNAWNDRQTVKQRC